jgi:predicted dehydrogenase
LGDVLSVNVTMLGSGALSHTSSEAWMADKANGANTMTIVGGHTLDAVEYCFGALVDVSAMVGVQVPQWHLADTGAIVDVDAPDTILLNGTLAAGGVVSYLATSVPHHGSGWRMEAYGTEGTLIASSAGLPQITPVALMGAQGDEPLAPVTVPEADRGAVPDGPGRNIARSYRRMADAIRTGAAAAPDFDRAVRVHRLLDALQGSSDQRHTTGAPS